MAIKLLEEIKKFASVMTLERYKQYAQPKGLDFSNIKNIVVIAKTENDFQTFTGSDIEETVEWLLWRTLSGDCRDEFIVYCSPKIKEQIRTSYVEELKKLKEAIPAVIVAKKTEQEAQYQLQITQSKAMQEKAEKETYLRLKEKFGPQGLEKKLVKWLEDHSGGRVCNFCGAAENDPCESNCPAGEIRKMV
jgi:hypothetical protein